MRGETFALGLLAAAIVAFVIEPPWRMSGLILFAWFLGLMALGTIALVGGSLWLGTLFSLRMLFVAAVLTALYAMCGIEILRRGKAQRSGVARP